MGRANQRLQYNDESISALRIEFVASGERIDSEAQVTDGDTQFVAAQKNLVRHFLRIFSLRGVTRSPLATGIGPRLERNHWRDDLPILKLEGANRASNRPQ